MMLLNCGVGEDLRVRWTARSNQSILKGNSPSMFIGMTDTEAEAPKFGYQMQRADSLEKTLMLGGIRGRRRRGRQDEMAGRHH